MILSQLFAKVKKTKLAKLITTPKEWALSFLVFIFGIIIIILLIQNAGKPKETLSPSKSNVTEDPATTWTCSMHPHINLPKEGACPICFMDLIPLHADADNELSETKIKLSKTARKLAKVNTIQAKKDFVTREISLSGRVEIDKTREGKVTARFPGRIEKMYINYVGVRIRKGDHLYKVYSPEIFQIQELLITSLKNLKAARDNINPSLLRATRSSYNAAKERLRLYGFTATQIAKIEKSDKISEAIDVFSPYSGFVISKNVKEGDYIQEGSVIYHISDLSVVWVTFDAYEKDIRWLKYGEKVAVTFEAFAGETFHTRIAYVDPVLNPNTRTVQVRVNLDNKDLSLKPGMFATATIRSMLTDGGKFIDDSLVGKYISTMHPEIIKDKPGTCDICGMPLVKASDLGYTSSATSKHKKILIPITAPLFTGTRSIVYIEHERNGEYVYEGREVILGPRSGDVYVVEDGIHENERVVIHGVFKIDSAMQIMAKRSMMNRPQDEAIETTKIDNAKTLTDLYVQGIHALANDDFASAKKHLIHYKDTLDSLDNAVIHEKKRQLLKALEGLDSASHITALRSMLKGISDQSIALFRSIQNVPKDMHIFYCPMADNNTGAFWIDTRTHVHNPYYGDAMLKCGENRGMLRRQKLP